MHCIKFIGAALLAGAAISGATADAFAWDGPALWYQDSAGKSPGGGGIIGTGGATDHNITCANCHVEAKSQIDLKLDFTPPLDLVGGQTVYSPGQTYQVAVSLVGEHLGTGACGQYLTHVNNFAATVEDQSGKVAGTLMSDAGQSSAACPQGMPDPKLGTTILYNDCHAVISSGAENLSNWSFSWKAPASGSGPITVFYGAVDGDCDMMSMGDDVKMGTIKLGEATALLGPGQGAPAGEGARRLSWLALVPFGLGVVLRRRRRSSRSI